MVENIEDQEKIALDLIQDQKIGRFAQRDNLARDQYHPDTTPIHNSSALKTYRLSPYEYYNIYSEQYHLSLIKTE